MKLYIVRGKNESAASYMFFPLIVYFFFSSKLIFVNYFPGTSTTKILICLARLVLFVYIYVCILSVCLGVCVGGGGRCVCGCYLFLSKI